MTELPHVIWDMGGILYRYFTEMMVDVGRREGWPLNRIPMGPTGDLDDPNYQRMMAGDLDETDYVKMLMADLQAEGIDFDPPRDLDWTGQERAETWAAIDHIADAGHRQALLTNDASKWLGANWWQNWKPASRFDAVIDVVTVGVRKPAPEPYVAAAAALDVPPHECLFVDDMPVNCRGAEAVGMQSHLFVITEPQHSLDQLLRRIG